MTDEPQRRPGASGASSPGRAGDLSRAGSASLSGPESRRYLERFRRFAAPMGPRPEPGACGADGLVYATGSGDVVVDVDGSRYVDFAAGFGSLLLGHRPVAVSEALRAQEQRLLQALGDVYPSDVKIELLERLAGLLPGQPGQVILGQSGADAVSAALKTAVLCTARPGVLAFEGSYHGLSYGPLPACGLRESYRAPFAQQLNPGVRFAPYPLDSAAATVALDAVERELSRGDVGAVLFEPIAGRAGCLVPPPSFARELSGLCRRHGALLVADEIWTGLGRSGHVLHSVAGGCTPDLICLGKGLGGGLPISACLGSPAVMAHWSREREVVHTATFAGAPLACATALATLDVLERDRLVERSHRLGATLRAALESRLLGDRPVVAAVRGAGLMIGVELGDASGSAAEAQRDLLAEGYVVSLGGAGRESLVLTPALTVDEAHFDGLAAALGRVLAARGAP